jgi:hypothetical protein
MDDKVKLTKCQNHHPHGDVFNTWTKWARTQAEWAYGPADGSNSLARALVATRLHKEEKLESTEATPPSRSATCLRRLATTSRQTDLFMLVEVPFTPIKSPPTVKVDTPHSTCSSPLVKFPV